MKATYAACLFAATVVDICAAGSPAKADPILGIQTIDVPGAVAGTTTPEAINDSGEIAGTYLDPAVGFRVFSLQGGAYAAVDPANAVNGSNLVSLNNSGQIVGFANTATPPTFGNYFLASGGTFSPFPPAGATVPSGASYSGLNDSGAIAGQTNIGITGNTAAFVSANGAVTPIAPPTTTSTSINAINDLGSVVGGYFPAVMPSPTANQAAFLYANGIYTTLDVPGSTFTEATGINNDGVVVGYFDQAPITGPGGIQVTPITGFTYANGVYTDYSVPGQIETELFGINDSGQVVGYYGDEMGNADGFTGTTVPEPGSLPLVLTAVAGLAVMLAATRRPVA